MAGTLELDREGPARPGFGPVIEAVGVFIAYWLLTRLHEITWLSPVQARLVGYNFNAHVLMVLMPVAVIWISGRRLSELGIDGPRLRDRETIRIGAVVAVEIALIWALVFLAPAMIQGKRLAVFVPPSPFEHGNVAWGIAVTIIFTTVFCGIGEEIFFRGYLQGRINRGLGRPFTFMGIRFGWGLIISSAVFGLGHGLAFWNPIADRTFAFHMQWTDAVVTLFEGAILGLLYERTNGIIAPAALHAAIGLFFGSFAFV